MVSENGHDGERGTLYAVVGTLVDAAGRTLVEDEERAGGERGYEGLYEEEAQAQP